MARKRRNKRRKGGPKPSSPSSTAPLTDEDSDDESDESDAGAPVDAATADVNEGTTTSTLPLPSTTTITSTSTSTSTSASTPEVGADTLAGPHVDAASPDKAPAASPTDNPASSPADKSASPADKSASSPADKSASSPTDKSAAKSDKAAEVGAALRDAKRGKKKTKQPLPEVIVRNDKLHGTPSITDEPAKAPVFWFGFEVAWAKLAATRVMLFTLLALDAVLQLSHAPRYGAGGFNVGQIQYLDNMLLGRVVYGTAQLVMAYVFVLVAFGVATRVLVPIGAAIYVWLYFGSQLDSYQHHYLVALVVVIASFIPWQRPDEGNSNTPVRAWAVRLLLVQLAIMYLWAAISKMNLAWVDGTTLSMQMHGSIGKMIATTVGFKVASVMIIVVELTLAATVWTRPGWRIAAPLGLLFHVGIVFTGLEIGLFAFLMVGMYALVIPDRVWVGIVKPLDGIAKVLAKPTMVGFVAGVGLGVLLAKFVRFEDALVIGAGLAIVPIGLAIYSLTRGKRPAMAIPIAHVVAIVLWMIVDRGTSTTIDYYRFWGGSQRRIGSLQEAEHAYRRLTQVAPEEEGGHYQLGKMLIKRGAVEEGLVHLREAQRLEPAKARAFMEEAKVLAQQGKTVEAIEKAKQATYADPSSTDARALLDSLSGKKPSKAPTPGAGSDTPDDPE